MTPRLFNSHDCIKTCASAPASAAAAAVDPSQLPSRGRASAVRLTAEPVKLTPVNLTVGYDINLTACLTRARVHAVVRQVRSFDRDCVQLTVTSRQPWQKRKASALLMSPELWHGVVCGESLGALAGARLQEGRACTLQPVRLPRGFWFRGRSQALGARGGMAAAAAAAREDTTAVLVRARTRAPAARRRCSVAAAASASVRLCASAPACSAPAPPCFPQPAPARCL